MCSSDLLEQGVKGEKWFRLNDKIFAERNLLAAFQQVAKKKNAAGVDHETVHGFERRPQGAILSPLLSNVYLDPLDHLLAEAEEYPEVPRLDPTEDSPDDRPQPAVHDSRCEPDPYGLVRLLPAQQLQDGLPRARCLGANADTEIGTAHV